MIKEEKCEKPVTCSECGGTGVVGKDGAACNCAKYGKTGLENCGTCGTCQRNKASRERGLTPKELAKALADKSCGWEWEADEKEDFIVVAEMMFAKAIAAERERIRPLLKKCREIVDDDLENRPARHSLGRLHVELKTEIG